AQSSHELEEIDTDHAPQLHKYSRHVAFQIWENGQRLRLHSANAPQQPLADIDHGFSNRTIDGHPWRVFSTWDDAGVHLIHVAERADTRERLAQEIAGNLLLPLGIALPLLAILLWLAVTNALRPLTDLAQQVERREPDNLVPLDAATAPAEVIPLIERLNRLFVRIQDSFDNERRFTADAAHELRTPIAAIKAQAQVARGASDQAGRIHALDSAVAGCDRATHLIEQLLTLARLDSARENATETCPLRQLAGEIVAEQAPAALDKNVHIELAAENSIAVRGLPALLRILLRNLIDNAVRHTPAGTLVTVRVGMIDGHPGISVTDNGPGLSPEELAKISQRFYRPPGTAASGSGLGLSIVKRIAEIHAAELRFAVGETGAGLSVTVIFRPPNAVQ
ncbi:MAG TPA: ATP-binding protein, partial [Telluria sp.]|nr:ATP-binding protein [Telluria sp.]